MKYFFGSHGNLPGKTAVRRFADWISAENRAQAAYLPTVQTGLILPEAEKALEGCKKSGMIPQADERAPRRAASKRRIRSTKPARALEH